MVNGFTPALHHRFLNRKLEAVTRGGVRRLIVLMPPGSAKSTYASVLFPPWFLMQQPSASILCCSYSGTLASRFGKRCRNLVEANEPSLRYKLRADSKAMDDWETSNGGIYFAAGVGAGIAGHRADLALIDDPIGSQEEADSQVTRDSVWEWYKNDLTPRLKPGGSRVIIANRRHEDDLIGRILKAEPNEWEVIRLPMLAEEGDVLGRPVGDRLWPEWFTEDMVHEARSDARKWAGLYQQRPSPEDGDYFKVEWIKGYTPNELPTELSIYAAGDFAVSETRDANRNCFLAGGLDASNVLWVLPDIWWRRAGPSEAVEALLSMCRRRQPITFWAEKGHISKSLLPFIRMRMHEERFYINIVEVVPVKAKDVRARSIQARMSMGMVRFPTFAPWWPAAQRELLMAFNSNEDDFVDALAWLGRGLDKMVRPHAPHLTEETDLPSEWVPTGRWLHEQTLKQERAARRVVWQ